MSKFIEEFYYGNIDPQARSTNRTYIVKFNILIVLINYNLIEWAYSDYPKNKLPIICSEFI